MADNLTDVMDALGTALGTVSGLRVFDFPPLSAQPPFAFVDMPDGVDYDQTYGRGSDRATFVVQVGVGTAVDRNTRDVLAGYAKGSGTGSIKAALEAVTAFSVRVQRVEFGAIVLAGITYWGAAFTVDCSI